MKLTEPGELRGFPAYPSVGRTIGMTAETDYTAIASCYEQRYRVIDYHGIERALIQFVEPANEVDILEVGCGTGHWLRFLGEGRGRRAGVDPSPQMLSRAQDAIVRPVLVRARAEGLPWANQSFDRLFCINAFHHFRDRTCFLTEAHRVLRPGGGLLIVGLDPHSRPLKWWVYDHFEGTLATDQARYSASAEIREAMSSAGFADCSTSAAQRISEDLSVQEAEARGFLDRSFTSQLALLSEDQFQAGVDRLRAADRSATGHAPRLRSEFILWGTVGQRQ
jgi:ubiquinone/menaquinone biosynthesis C-methylase UbiE